MSELNRLRAQIQFSSIAMLILGSFAIVSLLLEAPQWVTLAACASTLAPVVHALFSAKQVAQECASSSDAKGVSSVIREYTCIALVPFLGLALALNMTKGKIGGGSSTVNGSTSYLPVYSIKTVGRALCFRQVTFNLVLGAALATAVMSLV